MQQGARDLPEHHTLVRLLCRACRLRRESRPRRAGVETPTYRPRRAGVGSPTVRHQCQIVCSSAVTRNANGT
jgi:hypothetical protein